MKYDYFYLKFRIIITKLTINWSKICFVKFLPEINLKLFRKSKYQFKD